MNRSDIDRVSSTLFSLMEKYKGTIFLSNFIMQFWNTGFSEKCHV